MAAFGGRPQGLSWLSAVWPPIGGGGGGALIGRANMFSEAQTSGSITQYEAEECRLLMKASSVSRIGRQPEKHYVTEMS